MEKTFLQPPFVGESRLLLVDGLVTLFDQVNERNESCWVSIEAPSGWGKTRVAQEFYARLAARQEQHYWPATILEASDVDSLDVSARRKRVFPNPQYFKRPPGSLPNFMWWGIACDMRNGVASQTLLEDLQQLDAHKIYLEATWAAHASFKEKRFPTLAAAKQALSDVVEEAASAGLGEVIEQVSGATVPGLGLIVKLGRWGIGKTKTSCETKEKLLAGGKLDDGSNRDDLLEDIVATVAKMARPGLPTVVFVEDFHKATPLMEELVERLVRTNAALLIITTSWPGELDFGGTPQKLFADDFLKSRILRIQTGTELPDLFHSGASMDELPKQALREIILSYYPHTDEETLEHLASRYNNPLPLELVCTMPVYQDNFAANGKLKLSAQEIDALPIEVEDLYRELWKALPIEAQQALALATLAIPEQDSAWHSHLIQSAIQQCDGIGNHKAIARMLETDRIPHGWARFIETWLRRFNEPDQLHIAQTYVSKFFLRRTSITIWIGLPKSLENKN
ncbi:hypothetical protein [endosymbiont of Lamellibrachia barhami]|uniref:hypothetical protein n=1 Tax=endosymbiont of Lamellibrachia barhami TaxID=205975 RepID=UPI0015B11E43|nr:hypothetical protein [endosymbiont of Lamellibrachia barhami]